MPAEGRPIREPWAFRRCPGCGWNPLTDEGSKACRWVDCPYLPAELDVHCPYCFFNFFTWEGNPQCHPETCPHGADPRSAAERARRWLRAAVVG